MREIKFRAWDAELQQMGYFDLSSASATIDHGEVVVEGLAAYFPDGPKGLWKFSYSPDNKNQTVMQFTGLHDKNGKEIYEGDIVKGGICYDFSKNDIGVVEFGQFYADNSSGEYGSNSCHGWSIKIIKKGEPSFPDFSGEFYLDKIEVIGNIHEASILEILTNEKV